MNYYTKAHERDKPVAENPLGPNCHRLAYRMSRELGISVAHATAALFANDACKEMRDE